MSVLIRIVFVLCITLASMPGGFTQDSNETPLVRDVKESVKELQNFVRMATSPQVKRLTSLYYDNRRVLNLCKDDLGQVLASTHACLDLSEDIVNITLQITSGLQIASDLGDEVVYYLDKAGACGIKPFFDELDCYQNAFNDFLSAAEGYLADVSLFLLEAVDVVGKTGSDLQDCFTQSQYVSIDDALEEINDCNKIES